MSIIVKGVVLTDAMVQYLESILWAETCMLPVTEEELVDGCMDVDEDDLLHGISESDPLDDHFGIDDFSVESLERVREDWGDFFDQADNDGLIDRAYRFTDDEQIAHDFWVTRQGHGVGFWDGDYKDDTDDVGSPLSKLAEKFGECNVFIGQDGCLHIEDG
jgi:hypothetical protein